MFPQPSPVKVRKHTLSSVAGGVCNGPSAHNLGFRKKILAIMVSLDIISDKFVENN